MPYTKLHSPWHDADSATGGGDESTPLNAAALDYIEDGIFDAAAVADGAAVTAAAAIPKAISGVATDKVPVYDGANWVAQKLVDAQIDAAAAIAHTKIAFQAWAAFTPTLTASGGNPNLGAGGSAAGRYCQIGKVVFGQFDIVFGTGSSAGNGTYLIALPVTAGASAGGQIGSGWIFGGAGVVRSMEWELDSSTNLRGRADYENAGAGTGPISHGDPWAWTDGYQLHGHFTYEAA